MSQSLVKNYIHIIFSTKHREPTIVEPINLELYSYLGGENQESRLETFRLFYRHPFGAYPMSPYIEFWQ